MGQTMSEFSVYDLERRIDERSTESADVSYTRKLLDRGVAQCAKKLGEEAVELALAAVGRKPRTADRRSRRPHLSPAGGAQGARRQARRGRGRARRPRQPDRARRKGLAQRRLKAAGAARSATSYLAIRIVVMEQRTEDGLSPYQVFSRAAWAALREDTPMTLTPDEVTRLRSLHDRLDMAEIEDIYLPLSRLLSLYVAATQRLFRAQQRFLATEDAKMPYVIGVAGSVAVGKSTTARVLQALLARWPNVPKVDLVTTDGFLYPNAVLEREGLMETQGLSGELRPAGAAAIPVRHQGRAPSGAGAGLFASRLRRDAQSLDRDRPAGNPHRRGAERAADRAPAARRQGDPLRVRLLRFLGLSRRRRGRARGSGTSSASWRCGKPRSAIRNPTSTAIRSSATRRPSQPRPRSGRGSISSTCTKTSCRRASAPT